MAAGAAAPRPGSADAARPVPLRSAPFLSAGLRLGSAGRHGGAGLLPMAQPQVPLHHRQLRGGEGGPGRAGTGRGLPAGQRPWRPRCVVTGGGRGAALSAP